MISKVFAITERFRTEFRAEAFNITNTPRWGNPNTDVSQIQRSPTGQITDFRNFGTISDEPGGLRSVRFGLRLEF
jgi:hypothetical protein